MLIKMRLLVALIIAHNIAHSLMSAPHHEQLAIGNLSLPLTMRPGPLLGFGQNIIIKNDCLGFIRSNPLFGHHKKEVELAAEVVYGFGHYFSALLELPVFAHQKEGSATSAGVGDLFAQLEYAFYYTYEERASNYCTIIGSLSFPTGDYKKTPPTGLGSSSFFVGITATRLTTEWYGYVADGVLLTTKHGKHNKSGNEFLYQAGLGRNIAYSSHEWILMWMLELNGTYKQKDKHHGITDHNSGGNAIFLCPSLWFSTQNFIVQAGVAPVVLEHLFGAQEKSTILVSAVFGWKF